MKKVIVLVAIFMAWTSFAQEPNPKEKKSEIEQFSPEQRNQLRLKKLILELDLNAAQQKEMSEIIAEQTTKHEAMKKTRQANQAAGKKPSPDERFAIANKILDDKIAVKSRVKKILDKEQFAKWQKLQEKMEKKHHKRNIQDSHHEESQK
jgi:hypothetical protein